MTPLTGSRRRAEDFARRLEAWDGDGGRTSGGSAEVVGLLQLVAALREEGRRPVVPDPAFAADLRAHLLEVAAEQLGTAGAATDGPPPATVGASSTMVPPPPADAPVRPSRVRRQRPLVAAATVAIMLGGSAGMASAAQGAIPGDVLYPVKRGLERAAVTLSTSPEGRGRDLLTQAGRRLDEVRELQSGGAERRAQVPPTLRTFADQAREGVRLLTDSFREDDDPEVIATVRAFTADSVDTMADLARGSSSEVRTGLSDTASFIQDLDGEAVQTCPACSGDPVVPLPPVLSTPSGDQPGDDGQVTSGGLLGGSSDGGGTAGGLPDGGGLFGGAIGGTDPLPGPLPGGGTDAGGAPAEGGTTAPDGSGTSAPTTPAPSSEAPSTDAPSPTPSPEPTDTPTPEPSDEPTQTETAPSESSGSGDPVDTGGSGDPGGSAGSDSADGRTSEGGVDDSADPSSGDGSDTGADTSAAGDGSVVEP